MSQQMFSKTGELQYTVDEPFAVTYTLYRTPRTETVTISRAANGWWIVDVGHTRWGTSSMPTLDSIRSDLVNYYLR